MSDGPTLQTDRLVLRRWRKDDLEAFARMSADPIVMEFYPSLLTREDSDKIVNRIEAEFEERGFGLWALEHLETGEFLGFTGLHVVPFKAHFTPAIEIGWRLAARFWNHGFATEAAREALRFGFEDQGLEEIVAFALPTNLRSLMVMERAGMRHDCEGDFDNPQRTDDSSFRRHVLCRISRSEWLKANKIHVRSS